MKAWLVRECGEFRATVVFAETRGKAKSAALHTEACEDVDFLNIEVRRLKEADKYHKPGKKELDWLNDADRIAMVKDCGFTCDSEAHCWENCVDCPIATGEGEILGMYGYDTQAEAAEAWNRRCE